MVRKQQYLHKLKKIYWDVPKVEWTIGVPNWVAALGDHRSDAGSVLLNLRHGCRVGRRPRFCDETVTWLRLRAVFVSSRGRHRCSSALISNVSHWVAHQWFRSRCRWHRIATLSMEESCTLTAESDDSWHFFRICCLCFCFVLIIHLFYSPTIHPLKNQHHKGLLECSDCIHFFRLLLQLLPEHYGHVYKYGDFIHVIWGHPADSNCEVCNCYYETISITVRHVGSFISLLDWSQ